MTTTVSNLYLFLLWETARTHENFLLQELQKKFHIKDVYEITWEKKNFPKNLRRFYGPGKVGNVNAKTELCGTGSFLLIIVSDPNPKFGKRRTSKGMELVNLNLFDNKKIYRKITGKSYAIHSSITEQETNDDLTMLLGINLNDISKSFPDAWDGTFKQIHSDIVGQNGWKNFEEFVYVLNSTINYVILRNFEDLPTNFLSYENNDIDILTDDFLQIPYIANGGKSAFNNKFPPLVKISGKAISLDVGYPDDGYYDKKWSSDILKRKELYHGFFVPSKEDYFYSLFYHAVFHQKKISPQYKNKLKNLANDIGIGSVEHLLDDISKSKKFLENYMKSKGYRHTNSQSYRLINNRPYQLLKIFFMLWKVHGFKFLIESIKGKIKRSIQKK